jgi:hypothetical protein
MDSISPQVAQAQRQAAPPAAAPQQEAPPAVPQDFVEINVPMQIPTPLVTPGADGTVPLQNYEPKLVPRGAIITSEAEVKSLVDTVKNQAAPPGTHPEINMSAAGNKADVAKKTVVKLANLGGSLATYSLMTTGGSFMAIPDAIAAPIAVVGGAIGTIAGLDQMKEALNLRGYYQGLKAQGVEVIPIQVPVQTKGGVEVQMKEVPVDDLIKGARDAAIGAGATTAASVLMTVAGLGGGPPFAIASVVLTAGGAIFQMRGQLAQVGKAVWEKIKGAFRKDEEKPADQPAAPGAPAGAPPAAAPTAPTAPAPAPPSAIQPPQEAFIAGEAPKPTQA